MITAMPGVISFFKGSWLYAVFTLLLFVMLFLGDGKTSYVDIFGAAVVVTMVIASGRYARTERVLPRSIQIPWFVLLGYVGISAAFSVDVGVSLKAFVRYCEAYLLFSLFARHPLVRNDRDQVVMLSLFGAAALAVSLLFYLFPSYRPDLPGMNLFWSSAGHSHITDILLYVSIPVLSLVRSGSRWWYVAATAIAFFMSYFQARVALIASLVSSGWYGLRFGFLRNTGAARYFVVITCLGVITAILLPELRRAGNVDVVLPFAQKTSVLQDTRLEYWRQAAAVIGKQPLTGSGPGTFSLTALTHQSEPYISSWYAHNYLIEAASEMGLVGLALFIWALVTSVVIPCVRLFGARTPTRYRLAVLSGPVLMLVYGLIDFSLSYLVVWMLFWSSAGRILHHETT